MVVTGSPFACIRSARTAFDLSSALGQPMCWPSAGRTWVSRGRVCLDVQRGSVSYVAFCGGVRSCGCPFGGGDVSVHRRGGFDPSVGDRRGRDADRPRRPRRRVVQGDRGARGLVVQAHRGRRVCGVRVADVRRGCRGGRAAGAGVAGADGHRDRRGRAAGGGLLRCGAEPCCTGNGCRARWSDSRGRVDGGSADRCRRCGRCGECVGRAESSRRGMRTTPASSGFRGCPRWTCG